MNLTTVNGYDFYEVSSTLQKAIRRGDAKLAGFFGLELWHSNYGAYVWKRLYTISAEDCWGLITAEIEALHKGYMLVNDRAKSPKGRIFISKAILLLCDVAKSRDADHLQNLVYDKRMSLTEEEIDAYFDEVRNEPEAPKIPDYAFDCHTMKGKRKGKTKKEFFVEEHAALKPRQLGLFDNLVDLL